MSQPARLALLALLALPAPPLAARAQTARIVDEGSFSILRGGERIGREEFRIARSSGPGTAVYVASATVAYTDRRLSPALRADTAGAPVGYQVEVRTGADVQERLAGQVGRGRFSARIQTPDGEAAREYVVADGALIIDDDVFHQYYFLGRRRPGPIPVVVPRRSLQLAMTLDTLPPEPLAVDGRTVTARRLRLTAPEGTREIWLDASTGVVLRVVLPSGIVAQRDELK